MAIRELEPERVARVRAAMAVGEQDPAVSLCAACADVVDVAGAALALVKGGRVLGTVCVSDSVTSRVEDLQYTLGEGPAIDACETREPVLIADLAATDVARWPSFGDAALHAGMRSANGFPMVIHGICIGALDLYNDEAMTLTETQVADALVVADVACRTVLRWQYVAIPNALAWQLEQVPAYRAVVHQATGMISVQSETSVDDSLALLCAHSFAHDRSIDEVADDVVARRLRFD